MWTSSEIGAEVPNYLPGCVFFAQFGHVYSFTLGFLRNAICFLNFFSLEASFVSYSFRHFVLSPGIFISEYIWRFPRFFKQSFVPFLYS